MNRLVFILTVAIALPTTCVAHEVRPAYLEIDQTGSATYKVLWKQPTMGDVAVHLVPHLSNGWLDQPPAERYVAAGFLIDRWTIETAGPYSLAGVTVRIEGLENTITDVLVRVRLLNDRHLDTIARPEAPSVPIALGSDNRLGVRALVLLGIRHILSGPDHLLFVLGLFLIVTDRWTLVRTVSAFTVAHSLTLAAATLGTLEIPTPLLNTLIALSVLFLAPEALRAHSGGRSLTVRYPWLVAFTFGLLHGMGFANGLSSLGLERGELAGALISFNAGVELGQIGIIALALALQRAFRLMEIRWPQPLMAAPSYVIGILGASWTIQNGMLVFGASA